jgi:hypothetical protein
MQGGNNKVIRVTMDPRPGLNCPTDHELHHDVMALHAELRACEEAVARGEGLLTAGFFKKVLETHKKAKDAISKIGKKRTGEPELGPEYQAVLLDLMKKISHNVEYMANVFYKLEQEKPENAEPPPAAAAESMYYVTGL